MRPPTRVWRIRRNVPLHVGHQQALVCLQKTLLWPYTPQSHYQLFLGFLCSGMGTDPLPQWRASNPLGSEEHFGDAIELPASVNDGLSLPHH